MALGIDGETTYTNSFEISIRQNDFIFIPRFPAGYVLDEQLYQRIYQIANAALYPVYTVLKQTGIYFVPLYDNPIEVRRGLFFPWLKGSVQRIKFENLNNYFAKRKDSLIPLMKDFQSTSTKLLVSQLLAILALEKVTSLP